MNRRLHAILLGGLVAMSLAGCRGRTTPQAPDAPQPPGDAASGTNGARERDGRGEPDSQASGVGRGVTLVQPDDKGRPLFRVKSASSRLSQETETATLSDSTVVMYHEGQPNITATAPNVKVDAAAKKLIMWGGITAKAPQENLTFQVERLTWDYATKRFEGTGGVRLSQPPLAMRADRLSGRTPVKSVDLAGDVRLDVLP